MTAVKAFLSFSESPQFLFRLNKQTEVQVSILRAYLRQLFTGAWWAYNYIKLSSSMEKFMSWTAFTLTEPMVYVFVTSLIQQKRHTFLLWENSPEQEEVCVRSYSCGASGAAGPPDRQSCNSCFTRCCCSLCEFTGTAGQPLRPQQRHWSPAQPLPPPKISLTLVQTLS